MPGVIVLSSGGPFPIMGLLRYRFDLSEFSALGLAKRKLGS
jgi:hypothetical protein